MAPCMAPNIDDKYMAPCVQFERMPPTGHGHHLSVYVLDA